MKIILIRHGQTDENAAHRHQPTHTPLSILGRKQAVAAGEKLSELGVTHVVSSPLVRALETASLLAAQADIIPNIDHDLKELERPASMIAHRHFSVRSLFFYKFWFLGLTKTGESYRQFRGRIETARKNLERLPDGAVVAVVSHTVFINLFVAHLNRTRSLWPWQAAIVFLKLIKMKNTGMVEVTCEAGRWSKTSDLNLS